MFNSTWLITKDILTSCNSHTSNIDYLRMEPPNTQTKPGIINENRHRQSGEGGTDWKEFYEIERFAGSMQYWSS